MENVITISGLTKRFRSQTVLDNVSLRVTKGTVFALLGENGAGKTTLIRLMLGYHRPESGSISVLGENPSRKPLAVRKKVGYVSDSHEQYEWMTVAEAGWFTSGFYQNGFLAQYSKLVDDFDLPRDKKLRELSKGMRAKTSLALALAPEPALLILDEPTSGLDPLVRKSFLEGMIDRAAAGQTVFLSSHQIAEVERVADHVAILCGGKIRLSAPLDDLKNNLRRLEISLRDPEQVLPAAIGRLEIVSAIRSGRTWNLLVRGECTEAVSACEMSENTLNVSVTRPGLEDIYVAIASEQVADVPIANAESRVTV